MNTDLIKQAAELLTLRQISLRTCDFKVFPNFDPVLDGKELGFQLRANLCESSIIEQTDSESNETVHWVRFIIETAIRLIKGNDDDNEEEVVVEMTAQHAIYLTSTQGDIPEECLREFGQHNGTFQVWPYWRALVQENFAKAQIPVFALPMFKLNGKEKVLTPILLAPTTEEKSSDTQP